MPLAPPLRWIGAEVVMVTLLGVWKNPMPMPQMAIRQTNSQVLEMLPTVASRNKPIEKMPMPIAPRSPGCTRSINRPAIGAVSVVASGQGVIIKPVCATLKPKECCMKKGKETNASICDVKQAMLHPTDMAKIGIRNKSTGKIGIGSFN